jgi:hypothetical protein
MNIKLETYGDLKKIIKSITSKQKSSTIGGGIKGKATDIAIDAAVEALKATIPGIGLAKHGFDIFKGAIKKPDTKKTNTWLDKLDIDDNMSKIIDNAVENGFIQMITKTIEGESDDKPLEQDFNMNQKLVDYLKNNYQGRTITGIKENKMKKSQLRQIIKEEISKIIEIETASITPTINSSTTAPKQSPEVKKLIDYLNNAGKAALGNINNRTELNQVLTAVWNGMNKTMQKDSNAKSVYNIISQKIK